MYEHKLNPDLLPSYATVDYIYNEANIATKSLRDGRDTNDEKWWSDIWYNSTKVTGIRTLRFRILEADQATTDLFINTIIGLLKPLHPDSWQTFTYKSSVWELKENVTEEMWEAEYQKNLEDYPYFPMFNPQALSLTRKSLMNNVQKYGKHNVLMIYYRSNKLGEKVPFDQLHPHEQQHRTRRTRCEILRRAFIASMSVGKTVTIMKEDPQWSSIPENCMGKQAEITKVINKDYWGKFQLRMLVEGKPIGRTLVLKGWDLKEIHNFREHHYDDYLNGKTDEVPTFN